MKVFDEAPGARSARGSQSTAGRDLRSRRVCAVLGPTNTGKTHYAIDRMLAHPTGMIGLPLRLLAREVYNKVVERVGADVVALITGEEKIKPRTPRYWVSTVEAMPRDVDVSFVALDEAQLAADFDRGHVFTDRLLNRRGLDETLIIGAATIGPALQELLPGITIATRPRLSTLVFAGDRKISRLPRRSAIVAFSADEVYAIAEFVRRQRGGAAVVLGALSPRTRNAQVELYQNGDVDYIVATDAIGMGLNLDVDHVAFASDRKFDGWRFRRLSAAEFGQIAGRAGRNQRDGSFGSTGRCPPLDAELARSIEEHAFEPVGLLQWRNSNLDFSTIASLQAALDANPDQPRLTRAPLGEDMAALDALASDPIVQKQAKTSADVARLWDVCQVPDYRKTSPAAHVELARTLFGYVVRAGRVPDDWFARQLALCDRSDGEIDALSARVAQVRTLNFIANRSDWLGDPEHWQGVTRRVEDTLSDALHERLAARFVDRRTSVLMRRLRENGMLEAEVTSSGDVLVEGQAVGSLVGFRFTPAAQGEGEAGRALNAAAQKALAGEIESRATRVSEAVDSAFVLAHDGAIRWLGEPVGRIGAGAHILSPTVRILSDEQLTGASLEQVQRRLDLWVEQHVAKLLGPLRALEAGEGLEGIARGLAFQIAEALGVLERARVAQETRSLTQDARGALRKLGVRFGAYHLFLPVLLKPAPRALAAQLWALKHGGLETVKGLDEVPHLAASGRTSFAADPSVSRGLYQAAGFRVCGERAVRVDILERLADLIRPASAYRPGLTVGEPPLGAADDDGFVVAPAMTSLVGCSGESFASILRSLGYVAETRPGPAITKPIVPAAPVRPAAPLAAAREMDAAAGAQDPVLVFDPSGPAPETTPAAPDAAPETDSNEQEAYADQSEPQEPPASYDAEPAADEAEPPPSPEPGPSPDAEAAEEPLREAQPPQQSSQDGSEAALDAADETMPEQALENSAPVEDQAETAIPDAFQEAGAPAEAAGADDGVIDAANAQPADAPEDVASVAVIEVWKPQRRAAGPRRGAGSPRDRGKSGARRFEPRAASGAPSAPERVAPERHASERQESERPVSESAAAEASHESAGRPEGDRRPPHRGGRHKEQRQRPAGGTQPSGRPAYATGRPRPERRPPDPDSPFAKLAALKAALEAKEKSES